LFSRAKAALAVSVANPGLDQFLQALFWKVAAVIILCGAGGLLLREGLQWLERRATRFGREGQERLAKRKSGVAKDDVIHCPTCNQPMVLRTARRGANAGEKFWGCSNYPKCRGTREI